MKVLHTSDWHLGHVLYGYDRDEEQLAMLKQIEEIVKSEQPDVMIVAGDVYHTAQPSAAVQSMFSRAIVDIHLACPTMIMVITAGNHDSGSKHEIFKTPWEALNVFVVGSLEKNDIDKHIFKIGDKGWVVAVPYAHERNLPSEFYTQLTARAVELNTESKPIVVTAHTTVRGCDFTGHTAGSEVTVGGIDSLDIGDFGNDYDYLALGHIHRPQTLHGSHGKARYSGTPLAVSFDEDYEHSVSIVTINAHGDKPQVETIPIENPHNLITLPVNGKASWDEAKQLLEVFPDDVPARVRLNVEVDDFLPPGAMEEAIRIAADKQCRVCHINTSRRPIENSTETERILTVEQFKETPPIEIAARYAADKEGIEFDDELKDLFNEVLEQLNDND